MPNNEIFILSVKFWLLSSTKINEVNLNAMNSIKFKYINFLPDYFRSFIRQLSISFHEYDVNIACNSSLPVRKLNIIIYLPSPCL
jgi:hypothetical protein